MHDLEAWLAKVSDKALPGGVAVAAIAAAMGAALAAKAIRVTLSQGTLSARDRRKFESAAAAAREAQSALLDLSQADVEAFRRLMEAGTAPASELEEAWDAATDVPLRVSETCRELARLLSPLRTTCYAAVLVDMEIGISLLMAGAEAGVLAARANIEQWKAELKSDAEARRLSPRLAALEQNEK